VDIEIYELVSKALGNLRSGNLAVCDALLVNVINTFDARMSHQYDLSNEVEVSDDEINAVFGKSKVEAD